MKELSALHVVADDARIVGNLDAVGTLGRNGGGMGVRDRAHAADALHYLRRIFGRAVLHHHFHAAETTAGNPSVRNLAVRDFHFDAEVTLDACDGINN